MLTGPALGQAIEAARIKKGLSKKALADYFGVKPPSIQDWVKRGTIDKEKLPRLWSLFADVVGPEHWGLSTYDPQAGSGAFLLAAIDHIKPKESVEFYAIRNLRPVYVCGNCQGGMPEVIHEGWPAEIAQEYAEVSTTDARAFVCRVVGDSMVPRYQPGEYALVEPGTTAEIEDDVLVRLNSGESMLKRLIGRRGGIRLGSYNSQEVITLREDEVSWMYYVAHPVPAKKIKQRTDLQPVYNGPERRRKEVPVEVDLRTRGHFYDTEGKDYPRDQDTAARLRKLAG
jgi:transcriptional regulator with XRE-family HTH domain